MDRKLIDYLPPVLREVMEYRVITEAQQPEIEDAWNALNLVLDNQFIETADESGVTVWESELNIIPLTTDTLEERKKRIKTMWVFGLLYTHKWLINWLNDKTNSDVTVYIKDYCLNVLLPATSNFLQIINTLIKYVPVNLFIWPKIKYQAFVRLETGVLMRTHIKQSLLCASVNASDILSGDDTTILTDENGNLLYDNFKYLQLEG